MTAVFAPRTFIPRSKKEPLPKKPLQDDSSLAERIFIDQDKVDSVSSFLQKYPGKIFIIGPESQITTEKISQVVKGFQEILDQEKEFSNGIFTDGEMTLWYTKKI